MYNHLKPTLAINILVCIILGFLVTAEFTSHKKKVRKSISVLLIFDLLIDNKFESHRHLYMDT